MILHREDGCKITYKEERPYKIDEGVVCDSCDHSTVGILYLSERSANPEPPRTPTGVSAAIFVCEPITAFAGCSQSFSVPPHVAHGAYLSSCMSCFRLAT